MGSDPSPPKFLMPHRRDGVRSITTNVPNASPEGWGKVHHHQSSLCLTGGMGSGPSPLMFLMPHQRDGVSSITNNVPYRSTTGTSLLMPQPRDSGQVHHQTSVTYTSPDVIYFSINLCVEFIIYISWKKTLVIIWSEKIRPNFNITIHLMSNVLKCIFCERVWTLPWWGQSTVFLPCTQNPAAQ